MIESPTGLYPQQSTARFNSWLQRRLKKTGRIATTVVERLTLGGKLPAHVAQLTKRDTPVDRQTDWQTATFRLFGLSHIQLLIGVCICLAVVPLLTRDSVRSVIFSFWYNLIIARQHTDARYWYSKSVRPSVCLSVRYVPVLYENGLTYYHSFSPYGSPIIPTSHPCGGTNYRWGIKISRFWTNKSITRYISQMIQDSAIVTMKGE